MSIEDLIDRLKASTKADRDLDVEVFLALFPAHRIWGGNIVVPEGEPDYWGFTQAQYDALDPKPRVIAAWDEAYRTRGTPIYRKPDDPLEIYSREKWAMLTKSPKRFSVPQLTFSVDAALDAMDRRWPDSYYTMAKGRLMPLEPLYGVRILTFKSQLIGEEEAEVNLATAICAAMMHGIRRGK